MHPAPGPASPGAEPSDPWFARLALHLLPKVGPGWLTVWLVLVIGGLVALAVVAGPWLPGAITVVVGLTAGGAVIAKRLEAKPAERPLAAPVPGPTTAADPALDQPP